MERVMGIEPTELLRAKLVSAFAFDGSNLGHAAIDEEFDSIDEAAVIGSEEQDSLRNFIRDANASKRDYGSLGGYETRHLLFGQTKLVVTWCRYGAGADDIYTDLVVFQIDDPASREGTQRGFARGIDAERRHALDRNHRRVEDDRRSSWHQRQGLLHGEQCSLHIALEGLVKTCFGDRAERQQFTHAGVGEQNVDPSLFSLDPLKQAVEIGEIGDVAANADSIGADLCHGCVELVLAPSGDEDESAFGSK